MTNVLFFSLFICVASSSLLGVLIHDLMNHNNDSEAFSNILHPIIRTQTHLFGDIVHKILSPNDTEIARNFFEYFIKTASRQMFDEYVVFDNMDYAFSDRPADDIWKLMQMLHHFDFDEFVSYILFNHSDNKFHIKIKRIEPWMTIETSPSQNINWSMIPSFLSSILFITFNADPFENVDISSIDPWCRLQKLSIHIDVGCIILPDYSLPPTLKALELRVRDRSDHGDARWNDTKMTDYNKLWSIGSKIESLTLFEQNTHSLEPSDFHGIENMIYLKWMNTNFDDETIERIKKRMLRSPKFVRIPRIHGASDSVKQQTAIKMHDDCSCDSLWFCLKYMLAINPVAVWIAAGSIAVGAATLILLIVYIARSWFYWN